MGRLRDKFSKLSAKWPASRSTSPAPAQPSESTAAPRVSESLTAGCIRDESIRPISERLWNQAYDDLKTAEPSKAIVEAYEKVLSNQLQAPESPNIISLDHDVRWRQMEQLVFSGLESTRKDAERKEKASNWLDMSKPLREAVGTGLKAVPQAAVPWAGICCALEILSSPLTEPKKNRDGMEYVLKRMDWYWKLAPWMLQYSNSSDSSKPLREQLEKQIMQLYQKLLLFQMKSVILYHRGRFAIFMRDVPKMDDWVTHVKEVKDFETALGVNSDQYNTLEMRTNLQEISITTKEHAQWQRQELLDEKDKKCLQELRVTNPEKDMESIVSSKGGLFYESYRWIMESNEYQQWLNEDNNNLLWIKGDPGKGKTMLLAGIIEEMEESAPGNVFYFFCQATEPRLRTAVNVLRGLIWFLVRTRPRFISHVRYEYDREGNGVFSDANAWQTLAGVLTTILKDEDSEDCVFVIDALDECIADRDQLIKLICRVSSCHKPKWVVSSRNWPEIERRLDGLTKKVRLQLELNHSSISDAVKKFIIRKVDQLDEENGYSDHTRQEIQNHLMANADDTFLWVSLVCEELGKPDVMSHHTRDVLKSFPVGLGNLYKRMVEKLNQSRDRDLCKAVLGVVGVAYRPLSLSELGASSSALNGLRNNTEIMSNIVRSCGSFLSIRGSTVYTVHQSVKDFLCTSQEIMGPGVAQQHCNVFMSSIGMMTEGLHRDMFCLGDPGILIDGITAPESHALRPLEYACLHWADHFHDGYLQEFQGQNIPGFPLLAAFFKERYLYWLEAMSLLRCASEAVKAISKLKTNDYDLPQELKHLVNDSWRFVLTHRSIMDTAPLQLYDSALMFSPRGSIIRQCFEKEVSICLKSDAPMFQNWNACLQTIPGIEQHYNATPKPEFSPDGNLILVASQHEGLLILDTSTGGRVSSFNSYDGEIRGATWHPSGQQLAVLCQAGIYVHDLSERDSIISHRLQDNNKCNVLFSPDGQLLACGKYRRTKSDQGGIYIWNTWNKSVHGTLDVEGDVQYFGWVSCPSAALCLLVISREDEKRMMIELWGISTECFGSRISSLTFFPDGPVADIFVGATINHDRTRLAYSSRRGVKICCWGRDLAVQKTFGRGHGNFYGVQALAWAANDKWIIFSTGERLVVWDPDGDAEIAHQRTTSGAEHVRCGKGNLIVTFENPILRIWDLDIILSGSIDRITRSTPTQKLGVSVCSSPVEPFAVFYTNEKEVEVLNRVSGEILVHSGDANAVFGYGGCLALISDDKATFMVNVDFWQFDPSCGRYRPPSRLSGVEFDVSIAFGPPGQVALCGEQGLRICDISTCEIVSTLPIDVCRQCSYQFAIIAFARIGHLAMAHNDNNCKDGNNIAIWDTDNMRQIQNMGLSDQIRGMSLSENGLLAISSTSHLWIGSVNKGTWLRKYDLPHYPLNLLNFDLCSELKLETDFGVLECNSEEDNAPEILKLDLKDHWDPKKWSIYPIGSDDWLMKGSRRILRFPGQSVVSGHFSLQTDKLGMATVVLIHEDCLFKISVHL